MSEEIVAKFELNTVELDAEFELSKGANIDAVLEINATPEKVSQLENDLNYQTETQVQDAIQAESTVINGRIDEEVARLEDEIEQSVTTIEGSDLIGVDTQEQTVTITSKTYTHTQAIAQSQWVVNHNLNKRPSYVVVDSDNKVQIPDDVIYNDDNRITFIFIGSFAGKAFLN